MTSLRPQRFRFRSCGAGWLACAAMVALAGALAGQAATGASPQSGAAGQGSGLSSLVYVPHDFGAPRVTQSGGTRAIGQAELPSVLVLAPPRLARTYSTQPTLYWYLSGPSRAPVRVTVQDLGPNAIEPLLEAELGEVEAGGIHATSLAEQGLRLEPGRSYEWSVALAVNPGAPTEEPVAKTILAVVEADPALLAKLEGAPTLAQAEALAGAGYWYEALELMSSQIAAGDRSQPWRELRAALLEQVGLETVAAHERQLAAAQ